MRLFNRQGWGLVLLLAMAVIIVAVVPKTVWAATVCNACKGTGKILEMCVPCPERTNWGRHPEQCYKCNRTGLVCPYCNYCGGTGKIYTPAEKEAMRKIQLESKAQRERKREDEAKQEVERLSSYFTDSRDGRKYRSVEMGDGKIVMAENLNYQTGNSWCYNDDNSYCNKYGRLYDWNTAKTACPAGWHLPSLKEWEDVEKYGEDKKNIPAQWLRSRYDWRGWDPSWTWSPSEWGGKMIHGVDIFGFSALPGGHRSGSGGFDYVGEVGSWWTATENGSDSAITRQIEYDNYVDVYYGRPLKRAGRSVRCIKNN
jgi:uncharacterized protein (TIGR02145 family)